jgi:uncharacterized protein involved in outer membrane biogenesis
MRRILAVIAGLVVLFFVLAALALRSLESGAGKDRVAQTLSSAIGAPVEIGGLAVSLFPTPGLTATQVRIGGAGPEAAPGIALAELRVAPSLASLLPGRTPTIKRADLIGLVISIRHTASGQWLAPVPAAGSASSPSSTEVGHAASPSASAPPRSGAASAKPGAHVATAPRSRATPASSEATGSAASAVAIDALQLKGGAIRVVDELLRNATGGPSVTTISGINAALQFIDGTLSVPNFDGRLGQTVVRGSAEAGAKGITLHLASSSLHQADLPAMLALAGMPPMGEISISGKAPVDVTTHVAADFVTLTVNGQATLDQLQLGRLTMQAVRLPFRLEHNVFTSDPITFTAYAGRERGRVSVNFSTTPASFSLRTTLDQLDVNQALSATTTIKNVLFGTGQVSADVTGTGMSQPEIERSLTGTVKFALTDGDIRNLPVLSEINRVMGITSGATTDTKFQSLSGTASIADGQARTNDLALHAGDFSLAGSGTLGFDQSLNFALTAQLSAAKSGQLAQAVPLVKRLESASGEIQLPVKVTGTASAPKIGGIDLQSVAKKQLPGLLQQLLKK